MTSMRTSSLVMAALLAASTLQAQASATTPDPRWLPFLGCWATSSSGSRGPTVCLLPTDKATQVEMLSVSNDSILSRTMVTATGQRTAVTRDGCTGWETATWSTDDRRLFTRAEFSCGGGATQVASGIYAMAHTDAFTRIEGVKTKGAARARAVNFVWVDEIRVPKEIAARLPDLTGLGVGGARVEAAADLTTADVVEASKAVDAAVVEAWLGDRAQPFTVAARDLRALRDAGVTPAVIDMIVAVSHPRVFAVAPGLAPGARLPELTSRNRSGMSFAEREAYEREIRRLRLQSAFAYGWGDTMFPFYGGGSLYGSGFFSPFYNGFYGGSWGLGNPYLYNGAYFNGYNGFNGGGVGVGGGTIIGNGPYVIVPARPTQTDPGRVVNGAGYSQNSGSGGGNVARPTPSVSSGGYSNGGGSSSSGGTSGGGASGGSTSGGGEARTAKPRP